jgi:natural product biosynthesis luciferase-like monooxygenase protein
VLFKVLFIAYLERQVMSPGRGFDCCIIGQGKLTIECAEYLLAQGNTIRGIITDNTDVAFWADSQSIAHINAQNDSLEFLQKWSFDYLFSIINPSQTSAKILSLPKISAINFHDAPLPKYAGLHVTSWAIQNQETEFGVTWHEMSSTFDAGDILVQTLFPIEADETAFSLSVKCYQQGLESFKQLLSELSAGQVTRIPQDITKRSVYFASQKPTNAALIDWRQSAQQIIALTRGLDYQLDDNPLSAPKIYVEGQFYLLQGEVSLVDTGVNLKAGEVLSKGKNALIVSVSDNAIKLDGLTTLEGESLDINQIAGLEQGAQLSILDDALLKRLDSVCQHLGKVEKYWRTKLYDVEPFTFAGHGAAPASSVTLSDAANLPLNIADSVQKALQSAYPEYTLSELISSLYVCFLRRMADSDAVDIGWGADLFDIPQEFRGLYADRLPLSLNIDVQQPVKALVALVATALKSLSAKGSYPRDLFSRTKTLKASTLPVSVACVDTLSTSMNASADTLQLILEKGSARGQWQFNQTSLSTRQVAEIADKFNGFLSHAIAQFDTPLSHIYLLTDAERQTVLVEWNNTQKIIPEHVCMHQLIETQVAKCPDAIALAFRDQKISYRQLNEQANALALNLQSLGAGPDKLVGIFIARSIEMVVALLAVHKAGAAYVPLDPAYPRDRIALMIGDAQAEILLTHSKLVTELPTEQKAVVVCVDQLIDSLAPEVTNCKSEVKPANLAYVIYTSGSTGTPKGVMVEHRNVVNFMAGMDDTLNYQGDPGVWLAVTSISFDISVLEIFWSLARGFKVVIQEEEAKTINLAQTGVSQVNRKMDVGLFYFSSDAGPSSKGDRYKLLLEGAKFADEHQFSSVWTPERHFHLFGGLYPNPSVTSAAIAAVTKNIAIRAGSIVLPLHNPIRVAEEWSVVDNLSNGRVGFSFASGWHANDFALMPENFENRKQLMFEGIETLKKLWRGDTISVMNGENKPFEAKIYPAPVQDEPPIWITTAGNIETFRQAGEGGYNILTNLLGQSIEDITQKINAYREGRKAKGHAGDGNISLMVHTFVGQDVDEVKEIVREPFCSYLKMSFDLVKIAPWAFPAFSQPSKSASQDQTFDPSTFTSEDMDALIDHAFERYFETAGIFGTPASCIALIDQLKQAGVDEVACLVDFGVDDDVVLENLPHLNRLRELANPDAFSIQEEDYSTAKQIHKHSVTHFQCTPSMARILVSDPETLSALGCLDKFLLGGEALPDDLAETLAKNTKGELINVYGPTETTIWSTSGLVSVDRKEVSIGRPIANTQLYVLDSAQQPLPVGVPGELLIGGKGVVRGYLNRNDLTDDRFIDNPFSEYVDNESKIYRTGDLVKYKSNGEVEFLGRLDHQVKLRGYRIELGEIEALITAHPLVKESLITAPISEDGVQSLLAYVVPNPQGKKQETGHWQTLWDEAYKGNIAADMRDPSSVDTGVENSIERNDPTFNTSGWLNSFTGHQHEQSHMKEWRDATVERIFALKPKRVLEIGCGTGMILYQVAPQCEAYTGVDFSQSALEMIEQQANKMGMKNVSLVQSAADLLELGEQAKFDLVIINSVAQYFPSSDYLVKVLGNITELLTDDGQIFVGDVRYSSLKSTFHAAIALAKAPASLSLPDLKERIAEQVENDGELLIHPDFFGNFPAEMTSLSHVNVQLKRGHYVNEMSGYRYDVVLSQKAPNRVLSEQDFKAMAYPGSLQALRQVLEGESALVIRNIPNARLVKDIQSQNVLQEGYYALVSDVHNAVLNQLAQNPRGLDPEDVYQLDSAYQIELNWSASGHKDCFDAYFYQGEANSLSFTCKNAGQALNSFCEEPKQQSGDHELSDAIKLVLRDKLPEFMVPDHFIFLPHMPLTPNGKINRHALPLPEKRQRETEEVFVEPKSDIEQIIAEVFRDMLGLEKIGTKDNFFSLGVNSLLIAQANNRLNQRLDKHVSLVAMYRFPTIFSLAEHLSADRDVAEGASKGTDRAEKRKAALGARRKRVVRRR